MSMRTFWLGWIVSAWAGAACAQQVADMDFVPPVGPAAFGAGRGPRLCIDAAHHNFHTADGRYKPFAALLERDGYRVDSNTAPFSAETLRGVDILVISNALAAQNTEDWFLPTPSAFDSAEIAAVESWVRAGGALLLIADHMPFPGAASDLAARFGVFLHNGFAVGPDDDAGPVTFSRSNNGLADHAITRGRSDAERVDTVVSFTGQAFRAAPGTSLTPLLTLGPAMVLLLPEEAWQFSKRTPRVPAAGYLQGAVLQHGRGRVAVFGEAAMFSAQLGGPQQKPMGMNHPDARQNGQFLLNVVHWLSGLLPAD